MESKKQRLFLVLAGIFITNAILAELIGVKIFSAESTFGFAPAQIKLFGDFILDFNLTAGTVMWPVVFLTTDVINEYFGKEGVKRITYLTVGLIIYVFVMVWIVTQLSPAAFWLDVNGTDPNGNAFDMNYAFNTVYLQGLGIIIGSMVAFLIGQFLDVYVFQKLRKITGSKQIWLRATGSTLVSQLVDSFVVLFIAFYVFAQNPWSMEQIASVGIINYIYKFSIAILLTPLIYLAHYLIDNYLGKSYAHQISEEASQNSKGFF